MVIDVVKDFTDTPGARFKWQGSFSGEEFRDDILYPKFIEALKEKKVLTVNLDGGYGYGSSFLEESFGGLVNRLKKEKNKNYKKVLDIVIISNDNKVWNEKIKSYIESAIVSSKGGK
ncbi:MAG: STAS-like domain-containing protein [Bacilli bacterium]|nr:STAS-like domain-containing protein [Bacilli bacterium]